MRIAEPPPQQTTLTVVCAQFHCKRRDDRQHTGGVADATGHRRVCASGSARARAWLALLMRPTPRAGRRLRARHAGWGRRRGRDGTQERGGGGVPSAARGAKPSCMPRHAFAAVARSRRAHFPIRPRATHAPRRGRSRQGLKGEATLVEPPAVGLLAACWWTRPSSGTRTRPCRRMRSSRRWWCLSPRTTATLWLPTAPSAPCSPPTAPASAPTRSPATHTCSSWRRRCCLDSRRVTL